MIAKDEQEWFRKFYEGTFLVKGWKHRIKELLEKVPPADKEKTGEMLASLGEKIGREWARDNSVRRIDTAMLQKWGENLGTAKDKGHEALGEEIRKLDAEVDKILG